ncbi:MAG: hypothetical protein RSH25_08265, partial [Bacteroides sp.]|uniref:hypothetical protein n=1 Tax=Bacteroides sp. TaxID=29523 RepID=UPI002FCBC369
YPDVGSPLPSSCITLTLMSGRSSLHPPCLDSAGLYARLFESSYITPADLFAFTVYFLPLPHGCTIVFLAVQPF